MDKLQQAIEKINEYLGEDVPNNQLLIEATVLLRAEQGCCATAGFAATILNYEPHELAEESIKIRKWVRAADHELQTLRAKVRELEADDDS